MSHSQATAFNLDHTPLKQNSELSGLADDLMKFSQIDSQATFNAYCKAVCSLWKKHFPSSRGSTSQLFSDLNQRIAAGPIENEVIPTPWGGVVITAYQPTQIEKWLVINAGGYLALETHSLKKEYLEVKEGAGILLSRDQSDKPLLVSELTPGSTFNFEPGMEHCIIGTEDLLVFERSTEPKGMDQDLIFIYTPDA